MGRDRRVRWIPFLALACVGCASDGTVFVLMPDHSGDVGEIEVTNAGGSESVSQPGGTIMVSDNASDPHAGAPMTNDQVNRTFADALAAEPLPSRVFLLYFETESAEPAASSMQQIAEIVGEIRRRQSYDISVNGHTDRSGQRDYNMKLSLDRAQRIWDLLVNAGVDARYITVDFHGEGDPIVPTPDGQHEPRNRRVEVIVR